MRPGSPLALSRVSHTSVRMPEPFTAPASLPPSLEVTHGASVAADRTAVIDAAADDLAAHFRGLRSVTDGPCPACGRSGAPASISAPRPGGRPRSIPTEVRARIVALSAAGVGPGDIAARLEADGVATVGGGRWARQTIVRVLQQER